MIVSKTVVARPFVKWVGGKAKVVSQIANYFPKAALNLGQITRYVEPFLGGGAMAFYFLQTYPSITEFYLNDQNSQLIKTWITVRNDVESLITKLNRLETNYLDLDSEGRDEMFTNFRNNYNQQITTNPTWNFLNLATHFIFLNKTAFNGLYRVNKRGEFNVPRNKLNQTLTICDPTNLRAVSELLNRKKVKFLASDYSKTESLIDQKTLVYLDPPYQPLNKTSNFTAYSTQGFSEQNQIELSQFCKRIQGLMILSNSRAPQLGLLHDLYSGFWINEIKARRNINCDSEKRGAIPELVITNYQHFA